MFRKDLAIFPPTEIRGVRCLLNFFQRGKPKAAVALIGSAIVMCEDGQSTKTINVDEVMKKEQTFFSQVSGIL